MEVKNRFHVETACFQKNHKGEFICGDVFNFHNNYV